MTIATEDIIKEIDAEADRLLHSKYKLLHEIYRKSPRQHSEKIDFLKRYEGKLPNNQKDPEWIFNLLKILWKQQNPPIYGVHYYRGLSFTNSKVTAGGFSSNQAKQDEYDRFREGYEHLRKEDPQTLTLNSMLADTILKSIGKSAQMLWWFQIDDETYVENSNNIKIGISQRISDLLIGKTQGLVDSISDINEKSDSEKINKILKELENRCTCALKHPHIHPEELCSELSRLIEKIREKFELPNAEETRLEILKVIQGVCLFLKKTGGIMVVSVVMARNTSASCNCVGEFILFWDKNKSTEANTFNESFLSRVNDLNKDYFDCVLIVADTAFESPEPYSSPLAHALKPPIAKNIMTLLNNVPFNFDSLAGAIRLAAIIRPYAIHEGKQRTIQFVVGNPSLIGDRFKMKSDFKEDIIVWDCIGKDNSEDNSKMLKAKARIMGNSSILQPDNIALFIDCTQDVPTCNSIIEMKPRPSLSNDSMSTFLSDVADAFLVKIRGQRKIEVFHGGKKLIVWSDLSAAWQEEGAWGKQSLMANICRCLKIAEDASQQRQAVEHISAIAYEISNTGEGSSFIIYNGNPLKDDVKITDLCLEMTKSFPDFSDGQIKDKKIIKDVALEDGGVLINLSDNKFYGRRQWAPRNQDNTPFNKDTFTIKEADLVDLLKWSENGDISDKYDISDAEKILLYEMCERKYLIKECSDSDLKFAPNPLCWKESYKTLSWGTRHLNCMGMSAYLWDNAIVLTVSADGAITVFFKGVEILPNNNDEEKN